MSARVPGSLRHFVAIQPKAKWLKLYRLIGAEGMHLLCSSYVTCHASKGAKFVLCRKFAKGVGMHRRDCFQVKGTRSVSDRIGRSHAYAPQVFGLRSGFHQLDFWAPRLFQRMVRKGPPCEG